MNIEIQNGTNKSPSLVKLERLAKFLQRSTGVVTYKTEDNNVKIYINNAEVTTQRGIVYIYNNYIGIMVHLWLRQKHEDDVNIGIRTESNQIAVIFKGNIQIKTIGNNVIVTLEPKSKVEVYAS